MEENRNNQTSESPPTQQKGPDVSSTLTEPQPQISPNISNTPPTTPNKVSKKFILIGLVFLMVFLIIVLVISCLYFYLQKQGSHTKIQESSQNAQETLTPTPDPNTDWELFSNEEMGISFKYPADYSVSEKNGSIILNSPPYLCRHKLDPGGFDPSGSSNFEPTSEVYLTITSKEGENYSEIWLESFGFEFLKDELEEFIIDGRTSYYFSQGAEMSFSRTVYLVEINDKEAVQIEIFLPIYQFECENPTYEFSQNHKYDLISNQILSTFRFLPYTLEWKTFNDTKLDFTFKYPPDAQIVYTANIPNQFALIYGEDGINLINIHFGYYQRRGKDFNMFVNEQFEKAVSQAELAVIENPKDFYLNNLKAKSYIVEHTRTTGITSQAIYLESQKEDESLGIGIIKIPWESNSNDKVIEQILSTFKFIEDQELSEVK